MTERRLTIKNELGLHLRPAGRLCSRAAGYESKIRIQFREKEFDAKSLLSVLSACVQYQDEITLVCSGPDEDRALEELAEFIENGISD